MTAIIAPRATLPRGYPATPLVAPPDGARLSTLARQSLEELPRHQASALTRLELTRREPGGKGVRLAAETVLTLTQRSPRDAEFDRSALALHRQANAAYVRMRDAHIRLLPGYEQVDLTV